MNKNNWQLRVGALLTLVVCAWVPVNLYASNELAKAAKSTNITVDSTDLEPFALETKEESDERIQFYNDGEVVAGFNEDGDPHIGRHF